MFVRNKMEGITTITQGVLPSFRIKRDSASFDRATSTCSHQCRPAIAAMCDATSRRPFDENGRVMPKAKKRAKRKVVTTPALKQPTSHDLRRIFWDWMADNLSKLLADFGFLGFLLTFILIALTAIWFTLFGARVPLSAIEL